MPDEYTANFNESVELVYNYFFALLGPVQQSMSEGALAQQKQVFVKETTNGSSNGNVHLPPRLAQHRFSGNRFVIFYVESESILACLK